MPWNWPWNSQTTPSEMVPNDHAQGESWRTAQRKPPEVISCTDCLALEARLSQLESSIQLLRLEWGDTLEKLGRWASRQAARERRRVDRDLGDLAGNGPESLEDRSGDTNGGGDGVDMPPPLDPGSRAALKAQLRSRIQPRGR